MIVETLGCITIAIDDFKNEIDLNIQPISHEITIETEDLFNSECNANVINDTEILCGLVCSPGIGLPVLYASDGVIISIEGQYFFVLKG